MYLPPSQAKDLLHGGRYASCVHAGGLSCIHKFLHGLYKILFIMVRIIEQPCTVCLSSFLMAKESFGFMRREKSALLVLFAAILRMPSHIKECPNG